MDFKKGVIIIAILLLVLVGFASFYFGKSLSKCDMTECKEPIQTSVSYEEVTDIMNTISQLSYIDSKVDEITVDSPLSDDLILEFSLFYLMKESNANVDGNYSLTDMNSVSQKFFGKNVVPKDIPCISACNQVLYLYDAENKVFKYNNEHDGHGALMNDSFSKYSSITKEGIVYKIVVYKAFTDYSEFLYYNLYYTLDDAKNDKDPFVEVDYRDEDFDKLTKKFEEYDVSKLNKYEYTFEKIGDNYILKSYQMVK